MSLENYLIVLVGLIIFCLAMRADIKNVLEKILDWWKRQERKGKKKITIPKRLRIIGALAILLFSIFALFFLSWFTTLLLQIIFLYLFYGKNPDPALWWFLFMIIVALIAYFIFFKMSLNELSKYKSYVKRFKLSVNNYIMASLILSILILSIGFSLYTAVFKSEYPFEFNFDGQSSYNLTLGMNCIGMVYSYSPVDGDVLSCNAKLANKYKNITLSRIDVDDSILSTNISYFNKSIMLNHTISSNAIEEIDFSMPIGNTTIHKLFFKFYFENETALSINTNDKYYYPISLESYDRKANERITTLLLIISVGLFSVFSVINNIKNIIGK